MDHGEGDNEGQGRMGHQIDKVGGVLMNPVNFVNGGRSFTGLLPTPVYALSYHRASFPLSIRMIW